MPSWCNLFSTPHSAFRIPHSRAPHSGFRAPHSRAAFTLIEVALAALVIGLGLLTLLGLGRLAMQNAIEAEDDTRAAMLADDIFASLRSVSEGLCATGGPDGWSSYWSGFDTRPTSLNIPASTSFSNACDNPARNDGLIYTNRLRLVSVGMPAIPEWGARYWFIAEPKATNMVFVQLFVAPGAFSDYDNANARMFCTLFAEHGTLPPLP